MQPESIDKASFCCMYLAAPKQSCPKSWAVLDIVMFSLKMPLLNFTALEAPPCCRTAAMLHGAKIATSKAEVCTKHVSTVATGNF